MSFNTLIERTAPPASYRKLEGYYEGDVTLDALGVSLPPAVRVLEQTAKFPKLSVDVLTEVMVPTGFILGDNREIPELTRRWWADNNLDTEVGLAISEALVQGGTYWIIGHGTDDTPRITSHSRDGMATRLDHMGQIAEAVRRYQVDNDDRTEYAAHYEPGLTTYYRKDTGSVSWTKVDEQVTGVGRPTVVPMWNRARLKDIRGRSEIVEVITTTDAASRTLTNLQIAQELTAWPLRYLLGDGVAKGLADSAAEKGISLDDEKFQASIGALLTGPKEATVGQLNGADLSQIIGVYKLYAQIISATTGIPPSMLGISTDNPSSAEAMRVAKDRLISRAELKASMFGDSIEDAFTIALEMYGHAPTDGLSGLELRWRDPATASESARTAALLQAHAQGVISSETAREGLRLSPEQMSRERERDSGTFRSLGQLGA